MMCSLVRSFTNILWILTGLSTRYVDLSSYISVSECTIFGSCHDTGLLPFHPSFCRRISFKFNQTENKKNS